MGVGELSRCRSKVSYLTSTLSDLLFISPDNDRWKVKPVNGDSTCSLPKHYNGSPVKKRLSFSEDREEALNYNNSPTSTAVTQPILRRNSSFLRVGDLEMKTKLVPSLDFTDPLIDKDTLPHLSSVSVEPPPSVDYDAKEKWVALDDGIGSHAPIAPHAVEALSDAALNCVFNKGMWTCKSSGRQLKASPWVVNSWQMEGCVENSGGEDSVIIWAGNFTHRGYGCELPAIRAAGIIQANPRDLFELLLDSSRVKEYNNLSLGREDLFVLQDDLVHEGPFGKSVTKVMKSRSAPPLIRTPLEFVSLLHGRELKDGSGYLIVTRSALHPDIYLDSPGASKGESVLRSEILMGLNLIRRVEGDNTRCLMINVTQVRSPLIPMFIASKIGISAASNFIKDIRAANCWSSMKDVSKASF